MKTNRDLITMIQTEPDADKVIFEMATYITEQYRENKELLEALKKVYKSFPNWDIKLMKEVEQLIQKYENGHS